MRQQQHTQEHFDENVINSKTFFLSKFIRFRQKISSLLLFTSDFVSCFVAMTKLSHLVLTASKHKFRWSDFRGVMLTCVHGTTCDIRRDWCGILSNAYTSNDATWEKELREIILNYKKYLRYKLLRRIISSNMRVFNCQFFCYRQIYSSRWRQAARFFTKHMFAFFK